MTTHEEWREDIPWTNPLNDIDPRPFLDEIIFPEDMSSSAGREALRKLRLFYCDDREHRARDISSLRAFVRSQNKQLFIIEGDVGVGKTWFIRYNLLVEPVDGASFGIIDMLRTEPSRVAESLYEQLLPVLHQHFESLPGGIHGALVRLATHRYRKRVSQPTARNRNAEQRAIQAIVVKWTEDEHDMRSAKRLLRALEVDNGPMLFIALDNMDRMSIEDQQVMIQLCVRMLRNSWVRLIVPLRRTSTLLRNRFATLNEVSHASMPLSRLNMRAMLEPRFTVDPQGGSFAHGPLIRDGGRTYTFPRLFEVLMRRDAGEIIEAIGGSNARIACKAVERVIYSNLLRGLRHAGNPQFIIAALMLADDYLPDDGALIINLFDNEECGTVGAGLIRLRVLELFYKHGSVDLSEKLHQDYLAKLGYLTPRTRLTKVCARLAMAGLVRSEAGVEPGEFSGKDMAEIGVIVMTSLGRMYKDLFLKKQWYFAAAKRGMVDNVPTEWKSKDKEKHYDYMTHHQLIGYLADQEEAERRRVTEWCRRRGKRNRRLGLVCASRLAEQALLGRQEADDGG